MVSEQDQIPRQRSQAALQALFVADALAMPVHWYYRVADIVAAFPGGVKAFEAPPEWHPSSIMSLHSTAQGGRKAGRSRAVGSEPEVIGDIILKGRRQYWDQPNVHYHAGMAAGENTLNAHCARVLMRTLAGQHGHYQPDQFLQAYIEFMTADPARHGDTYAESYHRAFFHNYAQGLPPENCAAVTHDTPSIGGLVTIAPLALPQLLKGVPLPEVQALCRTHLFLTHPSDELAAVCDSYVGLMERLLFREQGEAMSAEALLAPAPARVRRALINACTRHVPDTQVVGQLLSPACYISDAWPAVLYFLARYADQPEQALLANTHVGGDNVHRGAVLGVLLGLMSGERADNNLRQWFMKLTASADIAVEIDRLLV